MSGNRHERRAQAAGGSNQAPPPQDSRHNEIVKGVYDMLEGLLTGTKRLVVVSEATPDKFCTYEGTQTTNPEFAPIVHYKHTFKVEDCK